MGALPVQVWLLFGKQVQVVFSRLLVVRPGAAAKVCAPVVRRLALAVGADAWLAPDVKVAVFAVFGLEGALEPGVLEMSALFYNPPI